MATAIILMLNSEANNQIDEIIELYSVNEYKNIVIAIIIVIVKSDNKYISGSLIDVPSSATTKAYLLPEWCADCEDHKV